MCGDAGDPCNTPAPGREDGTIVAQGRRKSRQKPNPLRY